MIGEYTVKVAFLDRDGTINRDYPDDEWRNIRAPELLDGAAEAMRHLMALGYRIIIITNQYIIGEGFISLEQYESFTQRLLAELEARGVNVLDVFYCPHRRDSGCGCCKPMPGMVRAACEKYPQIDLAQSFFAGDSVADMQMAQACGLRFYGINLPCENSMDSLIKLKELLS